MTDIAKILRERPVRYASETQDEMQIRRQREREQGADEIEKLRAALNERCPVDAMDQEGMTPAQAAIWHVWGERCSDFEPECITCRAWAELSQIERLRAALSTARADALEEAARVVAAMPRTYDKVREDVDVLGIGKGMWTLTLNNGPKECAAAIRALATTPKE